MKSSLDERELFKPMRVATGHDEHRPGHDHGQNSSLSRLTSLPAAPSPLVRPYCIERIRELLDELRTAEERRADYEANGFNTERYEREIRVRLGQLKQFGIIVRTTLEALEQAEPLLINLKLAQRDRDHQHQETLRQYQEHLRAIAKAHATAQPKVRRPKLTPEQYRAREQRHEGIRFDDFIAGMKTRLLKHGEAVQVLKNFSGLTEEERDAFIKEIDAFFGQPVDADQFPRRRPQRW